MNEDMLVRQARVVLDFNWTGEYTMPGPRLYPHQWSLDSAFIAIGYSHYDQERATRELRHLFEAQWKNGLLPQLVFNPHFTNVIRSGTNFWPHRKWLREGASDFQGAVGPEPHPESEHLVEAVAFLCVKAVQGLRRNSLQVRKNGISVLLQRPDVLKVSLKSRDLLLCGSANVI